MVATFDTLDVVVDSPILDQPDNINNPIESKQKKNLIKNKIEVFLNCFISTVLSVIGSASLRMVTGMLGLLLERNDIVKVAKSKVRFLFFSSAFP